MHICKICKREFATLTGKSRHVIRAHDISINNYCMLYEQKFCPTCKRQIKYTPNYYKKVFCAKSCRRAQYPSGKNSGNWKSGRHRHPLGYAYRHLDTFSDEEREIVQPMARAGRGMYVLEHRAVMAISLDRPLLSTETVHHKNGVRDDNDLENLELWQSAHPAGVRVADLV